MTERINNDTNAETATHETAVEHVRRAAGLFAGYASACNGGAVMHPGDFFDYPERLKAAADSYELLLSALRSARRDVARLRDSLTWALNELRDGLDGPAHFCEFDSNPEKGACDFCEAWATARLLASSPPILEKNDRGA